MNILAKEDTDQNDKSDRKKMAICPVCGQKLFEVESLYRKGLFRVKCRRCKKYVRIAITSESD